MKTGESFECDYLPGSTLTVCETYSNGRMGTVKVEPPQKGYKNIMASEDLHNGVRLMLAHVFIGTELKRKTKEIKW